MNIFEILGIQNKENITSNALVYCFNTSKSFKTIFLDCICEKKFQDFIEIKAYTRLSTEMSGIPDIVIVGNKGELTELIIIENKLKADEGFNQTEKYSSPESVKSLSSRFNLKIENVSPSFIFLTLFPDQDISSSAFKKRTYFDLKKGLSRYHAGENIIADLFVSGWNELFEEFYAYAQIDPTDIVLEKLKDDRGLDGGYLYFRLMLRQFQLPLSLEIEEFFKDSRQGRRFYGAIISKKRWHPEEMIQDEDGKWQLKAARNFNIHIEPQYNVLNNVFNVTTVRLKSHAITIAYNEVPMVLCSSVS